jgi:hypothetical protein
MLLLCYLGGIAQRTENTQEIQGDDIVGPQYRVPEMKVYLTDEGTGGPYANRDVVVMYYWKWEVLIRTPVTDRMSNIAELRVTAHTDKEGVVIIPSRIITPKRPPAPEGAEFSQPEFMYLGLDVNDEKHSSGISIYDPGEELSCEPDDDDPCEVFGEVHRTVMLYPRPNKRPTQN